ncbi:ferredoxin reductase [Streptomyces sp. KR55]|uniref:ferredoxin reductase n=1 Tax=Streptomyces sp. KR55 TaxID=3457425 RepID=UPI003FD01258
MAPSLLAALHGQAGRLAHRATSRLTTPLLPDDYLALLDPLLSARWPAGRVQAVQPETSEATTLLIRPGRGWSGHRPGQYVSIGAEVDGVLNWRTYTISSAPGRRPGEPFAITVKALVDGRVSTHLARHVRPGTVLRLGPVQGEFVLPDGALPRKVLLLTAGIGVTPAMSMLRALAVRVGRRDTAEVDVAMVHSAPDAEQTVFGAELRDLHAGLPWFRLYEHHTRPAGRLTPDRLTALCPDWRERDTWICGPDAMLESFQRHWQREGLGHRLRLERFRAAAPLPPAGDGAPGRVCFVRSGVETDAGPDTPLLAAGEAAGVLMPSGCRMGICFSCVSPLVSGRVRDLRTGDVTGEPGELVQTCVSAVVGTVAIDL